MRKEAEKFHEPKRANVAYKHPKTDPKCRKSNKKDIFVKCFEEYSQHIRCTVVKRVSKCQNELRIRVAPKKMVGIVLFVPEL